MKNPVLFLKFTALTLFALLVGCSPLISTFDQTSYSQVISTKVDALALMDKSVEDYSLHAKEVDDFKLEFAKAIEYDKHRPNNEITSKQWQILSDPDGHLMGGFLVKWKKDGKESPGLVTLLKVVIDSSFNQIAELEIKKIKQK
jgi:hypothetical protein